MNIIGYRKMQLRELQLMQLEVMKELHIACVKNGIKYYLIAGSLLGAVRHEGFIPWDDDIDIAMMRTDFEKFKIVFSQIMDTNKYFLQHYDTDMDFRPALMRLCIKGTYLDFSCESHWKYCKNTYIDIFPLDNVPDNESERITQEKDLKRMDKLIRTKLYRIHKKNTQTTIIIKKILSFILSFYSLKSIQNKIVSIMTRYAGTHTRCVCSMASHYSYKKQTMPVEYYGEPVLRKFEDTEFYTPAMTNEYLQHLYGSNYMQIPPRTKRDLPNDVYIKE